MENHGQPNNSNNALSLAEKMKQQMDEQAQISKEIIQKGLKILSDELQISAKRELNTIEAAMKKDVSEVKKLQQNLIRDMRLSLKLPVVISMAVTIMSCLVLIGGTLFWIKLQGNTLSELSQKIERQKAVENKIKSWGVTTYQEKHQRFVVLPSGTYLEKTWTLGNRPAILLKD